MSAVLAGVATAIAVAAAPAAIAATTTTTSGGNGDGSVALPPGGPVAVFPQNQSSGGADPYVPFGTDPYVPFGVWAP